MMTQEEIQQMMEKMQQSQESGSGKCTIKPVQFPDLKPPGGGPQIKSSLSHLEDIQVDLYAELGQTTIKVKELLNLDVGSVLELNKVAGESVDVYINDKHFARGEVLVVNDYFAVRLNNILRPGQLDNAADETTTGEEGN